jgi:uncharacterized membrane protein YtjA (UPF0391 family)
MLRPLPSDAARLSGGLRVWHYGVVFLVMALVMALFGFAGIAGGATGITRVMFVAFIALSALSLLLGWLRRR